MFRKKSTAAPSTTEAASATGRRISNSTEAGSATIKGTITQGRHRVRAESGSLSITLGDDSNVTVKSDSQLGRVSWAGGHSGSGDEVVMGHGNARLDVEVVMGHAQVRVGSDATSGKDSE